MHFVDSENDQVTRLYPEGSGNHWIMHDLFVWSRTLPVVSLGPLVPKHSHFPRLGPQRVRAPGIVPVVLVEEVLHGERDGRCPGRFLLADLKFRGSILESRV